MRKSNDALSVVVLLAAVLFALPAFAEEPADGYALLVQQSPPDAGSINPGEGVHKMPVGQKVNLVATPKPGYRFLYWLGDVSKSGSTDTSIEIDSPKMVVAVYAPDNYEESLSGGAGAGSSVGGGGAGSASSPHYAGSPIRAAASVSPATASYSAPTYSYTFPTDSDYQPTSTTDDEIIDNGDTGETPGVARPIEGGDAPEPATIALMGLGGLLLRRRRK